MADPLVGVAARILPATVARLDAISAELGRRRPGEVVKRSDAVRAALERGAEVMERELGIGEAPKESKSAGKPAKKSPKK